jgi:ferredoxin-NADP reductase
MPSDPKAALVIRPFRVRELKWETPDVYTLVLVPADNQPMFPFIAGQWVYLHLLKADGTSAGRAAFSVASAVQESKESFELGIKISGDFTKAASKLIPEDVVGVQGPFGVFTLREHASPLVIFAGGIGISPFRSMIRTLWHDRASTDVYLFYSSREIEDVAYWEELEQIAKTWPNFHPVFTLTTEDVPPAWKGEKGRISIDMIKKYLPDLSRGEFLTCGPTGFMDAVKAMLEAEGVDTKARLRKELFG